MVVGHESKTPGPATLAEWPALLVPAPNSILTTFAKAKMVQTSIHGCVNKAAHIGAFLTDRSFNALTVYGSGPLQSCSGGPAVLRRLLRWRNSSIVPGSRHVRYDLLICNYSCSWETVVHKIITI
jgi:hypothetical protein